MRNIILFSVISLVFFGCSGVANKITESIDTDIASGSVNKKSIFAALRPGAGPGLDFLESRPGLSSCLIFFVHFFSSKIC